MKIDKHDRRSQRTHRLLSEALVALMMEHRYAELTVQDILDRANIGRTTFYTHYWDKDDLLASEMERVIEVLCSQIDATHDAHMLALPSLGMFRHLQEYSTLYHALARGQALDLVLTTIQNRLRAQVEQQFHIASGKPLDDLTVRIAAQFMVGTFVSLLQWWMENDTLLSPESMDVYFRQLTLPGVREVLQIQI